jgi:hypothetical protein
MNYRKSGMSQTELIDHLTPEQTARFPEFVKRWTDIGLSTAPTNREAAERAIRLCYQCAGIAPPRQITWRQSPLAGALAMIAVRDSVSVRYSIWNTIRNSVRTSVETSVPYSVWTSIWANVRDSVRASVRDSVGANVGASIWASVRDSVRAAVRNSIEGSFEAEWLSPYSYLLECGLKACEKLRGMFAQAEHCGWWWPFEDAVIVTDKPTTLHLDDRGRLHHPTEAAISYGDGWGVYAWHGTRIPKQYYDAKVVTPAKILREHNAEVRRALIERYGQDRFMLDCRAYNLPDASQYAET